MKENYTLIFTENFPFKDSMNKICLTFMAHKFGKLLNH